MTESIPPTDRSRPPGESRLVRWFGYALVAAACALTLLAWQSVAGRLAADAQARFESFSAARELLFDRHVKRLFDVARSFQGLFLASESVSAAEFRTHYEILRIGEHLPEVVSVRMDVWKPVSQALETRLRVPAGRDEWDDPRVDASRAHWIEAARDGNFALLTAPYRLPEGFTGVDIGVPVYGTAVGHGDPGTLEGRRAGYVGQVNVGIDLARLIANVMPEGVNLPYRVRMSDLGSVDGAGQSETVVFEGGGLLAQAPVVPWPSAWVATPAERRFVIEVGQRLWMLSIQPPPAVHALFPEALLVLLTGTLGTALLALLMRYQHRRLALSAETVRVREQQAAFDGARLRGVIDESTEGIITLDRQGVLLAANPAAMHLFGLPGLAGRSLFDLVDAGDASVVRAHLAGLADTTPEEGGARIELRALRADGGVFPLSLVCRPLWSAGGAGTCLGLLRDLGAGQRAAAAMRKLAQHDALTGLINREAFQRCLGQALEERRRHALGAPSSLAMMIIDLDRFKKINETLGHLVGDRVLLEIAARLRAGLDDDTVLARIGGDEFAVLLTGPDALSIEGVARRMLQWLAEPLEVDGHRLRVTGSIGITGLAAGDRDDSVDGVELMSQADSAMYLAKNAGRSQLHVHSREDRQHTPAQLLLEVDLHRALERKELALYFQPQFDCQTRALVGAEALLRWNHHGRGLVPPDVFIPMAEESGLIVPIGRWVLDEACRHARHWQDVTGGRPLSVAVNLSTRQMVDDDIVAAVRESLARHALPAQALELEITESAAVTDTQQARGLLYRLAELGVSVSIDDFGVGYSSLSYLRDLPVQRFKIDRSFLVNVPENAGSARLVSAMISMARSLEVGLVAEGVETEAQLQFLAEQQCEVAQGYLLGRPVEAKEFLRCLREEWRIA